MTKAAELAAGARAFRELLATIGQMSDADCGDGEEWATDLRDYRTMASTVAASLDANLCDFGTAHREGYLRALANLLCIVADGAGPAADWDPLADTEPSFKAAAAATAALADAGRPVPTPSALNASPVPDTGAALALSCRPARRRKTRPPTKKPAKE